MTKFLAGLLCLLVTGIWALGQTAPERGDSLRVRSIKYVGFQPLSIDEILARFKKEDVGLTVESQYDPEVVRHAAKVLQEFLAERGRPSANVRTEVKTLPPRSLEITFRADD